MAKKITLGSAGRLMRGDDLDVVLEVVNREGTPVDCAGWSTTLLISRNGVTALTAVGVVSGSYNAVRATNTQRITFSLFDDDTSNLSAGDYDWSARRTDTGAERVLAYGPCLVEEANQA